MRACAKTWRIGVVLLLALGLAQEGNELVTADIAAWQHELKTAPQLILGQRAALTSPMVAVTCLV